MSLNSEYFPEAPSALQSFDAFPKTRKTYRTTTSRGGLITIGVLFTTVALLLWEVLLYTEGLTTQQFIVEKTIGHHMQINLDITIAMPCNTLHINVQDAALDRILAGELLTKEETSFDDTSAHRLVEIPGRQEHVYELIAKARKSKFGKTSRKPLAFVKRQDTGSCRVYGSMQVNRVQADFHITAKGHGYFAPGEHVDHQRFNFSHVVNELSFGEYYPKLENPLDGVVAAVEQNFYKFQYYLAIVPTIYHSKVAGRSLLTNQYAVTEQSHAVSKQSVPGIFFKYDIEPLSLSITEERPPLIQFLVKIVNIMGGVMVSGNWIYKVGEVLAEYFIRRTRNLEGILNGRPQKGGAM